MKLETREKMIGKRVYTLELSGFLDARKALVRLGNIVAPAIAAAALKDGAKTVASDATVGQIIGALSGGISTLLARLSDDDFDYFTNLFAPRTRVKEGDKEWSLAKKGVADHFDSVPMIEFYEWLAFCFEANFADFFADAAKRLSGALPQNPTAASK